VTPPSGIRKVVFMWREIKLLALAIARRRAIKTGDRVDGTAATRGRGASSATTRLRSGDEDFCVAAAD
jgi:hypothetical protein